MELNLLQKIVLLALDDQGWFGASENRVRYGIVSAILFELIRLGKISVVNDEVVVVNARSTDHVLYDRVLNVIKASEKKRSLRSWIQSIAYKKLMLRKTILKQLIKENIIGKEEFSLLVVFVQTKFPLINIPLKRRLQEEIFEKVLSGKELADDEMMLLAVMHHCRIIRKNFSGFGQYIKFRRIVLELVDFKGHLTESQSMVKMLTSAMYRAILASNVSLRV